jgi:glycosyltransferase involved in cell wall biosynthesis
VTAEPYVHRRFAGIARLTVEVNNYPVIDEFPIGDLAWPKTERAVCYVGSITEIRGIREMLEAAQRADVTLLLAGRFSPPELEQELAGTTGWSHVSSLGNVDRRSVARVMARSSAGLVVLHPVPNYVEANPTKMFEYMSARIPVIASDFPAWRAVVERHRCGLCVDPTDPGAIAGALQWVMDHPDQAREMGENGRAAIERHYSWEDESRKLLSLYEALIPGL